MFTARLSAVTIALIVASGPATAQSTTTADRLLRTFDDCRAMAAPADRLACFDRAATALSTSVKAKEVQIVDKADVRKARRSLFGFTLPRINLFGSGEAESGAEEFTEITTTVQSARAVANNRVEIRLADGNDAVWQTTDPMNFPPKTGAKIRIRKGALGNYFLSVDGRSYRGMRTR